MINIKKTDSFLYRTLKKGHYKFLGEKDNFDNNHSDVGKYALNHPV